MSGGDKDGDPGRVLHLPHALTLPQHLRQGPLDGEVYNTRAASGSTKQLLWIIFVRSFKIWFWSDLKKRWFSVLRKACFFRDFFVFEVMKFFVSPTFGAPGVWPSYSWRDTLCMMFAWRCFPLQGLELKFIGVDGGFTPLVSSLDYRMGVRFARVRTIVSTFPFRSLTNLIMIGWRKVGLQSSQACVWKIFY